MKERPAADDGGGGGGTKSSPGRDYVSMQRLREELQSAAQRSETRFSEKLQELGDRIEHVVRKELREQTFELQRSAGVVAAAVTAVKSLEPRPSNGELSAETTRELKDGIVERRNLRHNSTLSRMDSSLSNHSEGPSGAFKSMMSEKTELLQRKSFHSRTKNGDRAGVRNSTGRRPSQGTVLGPLDENAPLRSDVISEHVAVVPREATREGVLRPVSREGSCDTPEVSAWLPAGPKFRQLLAPPPSRSNRDFVLLASKEDGELEEVEEIVANVGLEIEPRPSFLARLYTLFSDFVQSNSFDISIGLLIVLNAVSTAVQIDYQARYWTNEIPESLRLSNHVFSFLFAVELALRALFYQRTFCMYVSRNIVDTVVIVMQFSLEIHVLVSAYWFHSDEAAHHTPNWLGVLRVIRLLRLIRIIHLSEVLKLIGELRMLVASVLDSVRSCFWSLVLMLTIMFTFAVYITMLVTQFKLRNTHVFEDGGSAELLVQHFGTLDRTMLSLYEASTEGIHWHELVDPLLEHCSAWHALLVIAYMTFNLLVIMNIVTSVFVTSAMKHADDDKKQVLMLQMLAFFNECDDDQSGTISWEEFQNHLEHPQLLQFLREIDLHPEHARALFRLLDVEQTGDVDIDDIVGGCMRLHGPATSIDLSTFMREHDRAWQVWGEHASFVQNSMTVVMNKLDIVPPAPSLSMSSAS
eukprot:TRINITY_DN1831_c0_g4_i1.p1 TRINITY_DN1831_c0_g4~~TRINITY_DN1831_c0_g4_i1.p1  ORF type:complete len:716 (-),score=130.09 TRINITY_DN1831_c0_g4_i1:90-2174(-)